MVHTKFSTSLDQMQRFPYNRDDDADIDEVLNVRKLICLFNCYF